MHGNVLNSENTTRNNKCLKLVGVGNHSLNRVWMLPLRQREGTVTVYMNQRYTIGCTYIVYT